MAELVCLVQATQPPRRTQVRDGNSASAFNLKLSPPQRCVGPLSHARLIYSND